MSFQCAARLPVTSRLAISRGTRNAGPDRIAPTAVAVEVAPVTRYTTPKPVLITGTPSINNPEEALPPAMNTTEADTQMYQ